jgi:hypothetical protein
VAAGLYHSGEAYSTSLRDLGHDDEPSSLYTHLSLSLFLIPIDLVSFANNFEFVESELPSHRTFPDQISWVA